MKLHIDVFPKHYNFGYWWGVVDEKGSVKKLGEASTKKEAMRLARAAKKLLIELSHYEVKS